VDIYNEYVMCLLQHVQFIDNINHVLELVVNKNKFELIDAYQSNRHYLKLIIFLSHIYLTAKIRVRVFNVTFNNICYMVVASFKITTVVEIGADCTGSRKCNYYTITLQWPGNIDYLPLESMNPYEILN
jgi:hypothetical protein